MAEILTHSFSVVHHLTGVQHARQRRLLRTRDCQAVHALDLDPHFCVRAVIAC